ncbi:MAG: pyridoxal-phosphate dependent enzyme [Bdellovibrionales bacterium]
MLHLKEQEGPLPKKIVAYSSGNHAQAVAWAGQQLGLMVEIFMPENVAKVKLQGTQSYGAKVTLCSSHPEAEERPPEVEKGAYLIPPFDHDQVICGQGTACLEALDQIKEPLDAVFAPCGGGGLLSGTWVAAKGTDENIKVIGGEPLEANDAARTLKSGTIYCWHDSPKTIADGARTLSVTPRTLQYLKCLDGLFEITEEEIIYWTQCLRTSLSCMSSQHQHSAWPLRVNGWVNKTKKRIFW